MKFRSKFKNLFIVVLLCLVAAVPVFSSQINVKADTNQIPIFDLEPVMFYGGSYPSSDYWYLLIDKDYYEQNSRNIQVCANMVTVGYYCLYINEVYDYMVTQEWIAPDEWWDEIDFSSFDFPSFKHYKSKYYLLPVSWYLVLDLGVTIHSVYGVNLISNVSDYYSYRNIKYTLNFTIENFYDKEIKPLVDIYDNGYSLGVIAGKNEAFENYDNLLPITLGSIGMFFISIFGSINVFGMSLLTVFGIVGALLLVWYVLRLVMG